MAKIDQIEKLKKFFINKKVKILVIIVAAVILIAYMALKALSASQQLTYSHLDAISELLLIAFSIITTTLFTSWLIEVKDRNDIYTDFVCNEFLGSQKFYESLDDKNKTTILNTLEREFYYSGSAAKEEMYKSITTKIMNTDKVFYSMCKYDIDCKVDGNLIRKNITRTTEIYGHEACPIDNMELLSVCCGKINGVENFTLTGLEINGTPCDIANDTTSHSEPINDNTLTKCGYNRVISYSYNKKINFPKYGASKKGTTIVVKYTTIVDKHDSSYVCRVKYPCKHFSVNFKLIDDTASKYVLAAHPFGFVDTGNNTGNKNNRSNVAIDFEDWIFANDGVCIVIANKKTNP